MINYLIVGDDRGKIWVYDIGEQLAVPQQDDYNKFVNTLQVTHINYTNITEFYTYTLPLLLKNKDTCLKVNFIHSVIIFKELKNNKIEEDLDRGLSGAGHHSLSSGIQNYH